MTDALVRDGYPNGVPCWVDTSHPDAPAAATFYGELFGWHIEDTMPPDGLGHYFACRYEGLDVAAVGSQVGAGPPVARWQTYIWTDDAVATAAAVKEAGGEVLTAPFDVFSAGRMGVCADPTGAVFCLWEAKEHRGARLVNMPNTWNWSDLNTPDVETAMAFYGRVFGWELRTMQAGETMSFSMVCLPGYGDYLAQFDPEIYERQAEANAPEGFADAIAGVAELATDEVPAHWSVTFTVADADASAARAVELGGTLIMAPFDAGPTRIAAIADPQGATFSVLQYSPE